MSDDSGLTIRQFGVQIDARGPRIATLEREPFLSFTLSNRASTRVYAMATVAARKKQEAERMSFHLWFPPSWCDYPVYEIPVSYGMKFTSEDRSTAWRLS
jgi:hypothetical protein